MRKVCKSVRLQKRESGKNSFNYKASKLGSDIIIDQPVTTESMFSVLFLFQSIFVFVLFFYKENFPKWLKKYYLSLDNTMNHLFTDIAFISSYLILSPEHEY